MPKRFTLIIIVAALIILLLLVIFKSPSSEHATDYVELLAARPIPNLVNLAERSSPNYSGKDKDATEAFYDILKLREVGDANAIPVLEQILADHNANTGHIHGYAAAQALFCIGTPEAHNALAKYLLTNTYQARYGIEFTSNWQMNQSKCTPFIERYHLINLSKDLELKLDGVKSDANTVEAKNVTQYDFTLTLRNISDKAFSIRDVEERQALMLYFQSETGDFILGKMAGPIWSSKSMPPHWVELKSGESHRYNIALSVKQIGKQERRNLKLSKDATLIAESTDVRFILNNAGPFKVYAMFQQQPPPQTRIDHFKINNQWSGRAVSAPVAIDISMQK